MTLGFRAVLRGDFVYATWRYSYSFDPIIKTAVWRGCEIEEHPSMAGQPWKGEEVILDQGVTCKDGTWYVARGVKLKVLIRWGEAFSETEEPYPPPKVRKGRVAFYKFGEWHVRKE
jgi:hypothetical protein